MNLAMQLLGLKKRHTRRALIPSKNAEAGSGSQENQQEHKACIEMLEFQMAEIEAANLVSRGRLGTQPRAR